MKRKCKYCGEDTDFPYGAHYECRVKHSNDQKENYKKFISETKGIRESIFARDGYGCLECGATTNLTIDHIVPRSKGGNNDPSNLQTLCKSCNSRKKNK